MFEPVFVEGEPAAFLTSREKEWTANVRAKCRTNIQHPCLSFVVSAWQRGYNYFDLDNIAKPVLDSVGLQAATVWASMRLGKPSGVYVSDELPSAIPTFIAEVYLSNPPTKSIRNSVVLPELANSAILGNDEPLGVSLAFDSDTANIGNFGFEGPIKSLLDKLGPLLGTYQHGAADYRLREIRITKSHRPETSGVKVGLWHVEPE